MEVANGVRNLMGVPMETLRPPSCTAEEKRLLIVLAHEAIEAAIRGHPIPDPPAASLTSMLFTQAATFVTLVLSGQLRGCVGNLTPTDPLYRSVQQNAVGAALRDTRFSPVTSEEAQRLEVHISILSALVALQFESVEGLLGQITPPSDGVVLRKGDQTATYLPQVWNSIAGKQAFLDALSRKAGLESDVWKEPDAEVLIYRVSEFGDPPAR